ncbi:MAG: helix-turn-helix transcriptional regulator [Candidatus Borkfalkiaceae bacterium]|nr:helix-turn-helix transcriptional regulator [Eubacteriales bacterium]MDY5820534.1 helix-turn-helix transcriptional regulator [Christensenellaceae bacterium]
MKNKVSERIRDLRKELNIGQVEFAKMCGVQQSCVSKWERGETLPDIDMILTIAHIFDVTTDYLLGATDF